MTTWVALFRGINVGGNNKLPMAKLKTDLESMGMKNVRTYIQSGNVVFEAGRQSRDKLATSIINLVEQQHGFRPAVLLISQAELQQAIENNPYPEAATIPQTLHFFFLAEEAKKANIAALDKLKTSSERYQLIGKVFYLHTPDGLGRSKLAAGAERHLGVTATARNYRTVETLQSMLTAQ